MKIEKQKCESGCAAAVSINLHCSPSDITPEATTVLFLILSKQADLLTVKKHSSEGGNLSNARK